MTAKPTITVALHNFDSVAEAKMVSIFERSELWLSPWKLIDSADKAQVILVWMASDSDQAVLSKIANDTPTAKVVAYSGNKPQQATWHLQYQSNGHLSLLDLSMLLVNIGSSIEKNIVDEPIAPVLKADPVTTETTTAMAAATPLKKKADPVKTKPVQAIETAESESDSAESVLSFMDKITSVIDSSQLEKKKRFTDKD
jgi:hypothetical protein